MTAAYSISAPGWQSASGPAKALRVLLLLIAAAYVLVLGAFLFSRSRYESFRREEIGLSELEGGIAAIGLTSLLAGGLNIAIIVLTIVWLYRLAKNHELMGRPDTTFGPGWAIGGWFIPLAFWVIPFVQIRQIWQGSDPDQAPGSRAWKSAAVSPLLGAWWATWVLSSLINWTGSRFGLGGSGGSTVEVARDFADQTNTMVLTGVTTIVAAILYSVVAVRLAERQEVWLARWATSLSLGYGQAMSGYGVSPYGGGYGAAGHQHAPGAVAPAGWQPDPTGRHQHRYWDGVRWSDAVADNGVTSSDPL